MNTIKTLKSYALYTLLALCYSGFSQEQSKKTDTINKVCKERGHYPSGYSTTTLLYCESYVIDTDSTTVLVKPSCNTTTYKCGRCGNIVSEPEKEIRTVIWRKEEENN